MKKIGYSFLEQIKYIYYYLNDPISKDIFENRLMYSITGDNAFIKKVIYLVYFIDHIHHFFNKSKKVIVAYI